jgi:hypothetical protein
MLGCAGSAFDEHELEKLSCDSMLGAQTVYRIQGILSAGKNGFSRQVPTSYRRADTFT